VTLLRDIRGADVARVANEKKRAHQRIGVHRVFWSIGIRREFKVRPLADFLRDSHSDGRAGALPLMVSTPLSSTATNDHLSLLSLAANVAIYHRNDRSRRAQSSCTATLEESMQIERRSEIAEPGPPATRVFQPSPTSHT
jgi:hypothetical protein